MVYEIGRRVNEIIIYISNIPLTRPAYQQNRSNKKDCVLTVESTHSSISLRH